MTPENLGRRHPTRARRLDRRPHPSARPTTVDRHGPVVALRQRPVTALGGLHERTRARSDRLVTARDHHGQSWWIAASSVWSDADASGEPDRPLPIGLATAPTRERAMLAGLSDRLGWEAVLEFERGRDLDPVDLLAEHGSGVHRQDGVVILDGRLGHAVPTVVIFGREMVRWGAGATWQSAIRRALYGTDGTTDVVRELSDMRAMLAPSGLDVAAVDLDTPLLRRAGIARCSVQLVTE